MPKHVDLEISDEIADWCVEAYSFAGTMGVCYRLDQKEGAEPAIERLICKYARASMPHLCVYESELSTVTGTESNPHYHVFMFINEKEYHALRQAIKRIWSGNKDYSLKQAKPQLIPEQINYLCKGSGSGSDDQPNIVHCSEHFTEDLVRTVRALYWKNNAAIEANTKKRKRELPIHENILKLCQARNISASDRKAIFRVIFEFYRKRIKYLNPAYIRNLVFQTAAYLDPSGPAVLNLEEYCISNPF